MQARQLVSIAHSYCVGLNRRLADEMARVSGGRWQVTAVAPTFLRGDLRPIFLENMVHERCRVEGVPIHLSRRVHVMVYGLKLREILRRRWDLVHCWEEPYIVAGGQVAWWTPRDVPLVYATFQNIPKRYPLMFRALERYSMGRARGWIAFGRTIEEALLTRPSYLQLPRQVIPIGVDVERFYPDPVAGMTTKRKLWQTESGPPVVGFLGRFVAEKGVAFLMRSLSRLDSPWRALFVGGGPLEESLRRWGRRFHDRVRVVTGVQHVDVPPYLNAMDILCAPSQTTPRWREQFGRMLIEAFACGVPVVGSDSGEVPHVVGDAGIIVSENDEYGWTRAIRELLESPSRRRGLAARGLDRAQRLFSWPVVADRHLRFFEELLEAPRKGNLGLGGDAAK
jgi:glycosyltransferase involved in cell wall biosynthesis